MQTTPIIVYAQVIMQPTLRPQMDVTLLALLLAVLCGLTGTLSYLMAGPMVSHQTAAILALLPTSVGLGFCLAAAVFEVMSPRK